MATTQELVEVLTARYPEDTGALQDAMDVLRQNRITSCDRLARLSETQWSRLGLPLGIEAIIRDEVATTGIVLPPAAAVASKVAVATEHAPAGDQRAQGDEGPTSQLHRPALSLAPPDGGDFPLEACEHDILDLTAPTPPRQQEPSQLRVREWERGHLAQDGLHRRGAGRRRSPERHEQEGSRERGLLSSTELSPPQELESLWQQLLEDTLPPDKRATLHASWEAVPDRYDRYMMFLEYSSYLRKPEVTEEEKKERREQLEPLMREFGIPTEDEDPGWHSLLLLLVLLGMLFFVFGVTYYSQVQPDAAHEVEAL